MTSTSTDPYADLEVGDDDPIGPFDEDNMCGAVAVTYLGEHRQMTCLREPHPDGWVHVSCCDDAVEFVWRDLSEREIRMGVLTPDGFVCRECAIDLTMDPDQHYADCPQLGGAS